MIRNPGSILNYIAAALSFVFGMIYLFNPHFMPYHAEAVSQSWSEVDPMMQLLIIALMRATSGGFLVTAVAIAFLQYRFNKEKVRWIPLLILILGAISALTNLLATSMVSLNTPGHAPVYAPIAGLLLLIAGFLFNRKWARR